MKTKLLKAFSLLLAVSMLIISSSFASVASDLDELEASGTSIELDGTKAETVTVSIVSATELTCYGIEGTWDTKEQGDTNYFKLTDISSDVLTFDEYNYADVKTGKVMWVDDLLAAKPTAEGAKLLTATYEVAANTPAGTYTVRFLSEVYTGADGEPNETAQYFTAKITVTHKKTNISVTHKGAALADAYTVEGQVVTVTYSLACKVGYLQGDKYVAIAAVANPDGSYSFTAPEGVTEVLLVIKGDITGDGRFNAFDRANIGKALIDNPREPYTDAVKMFAADVRNYGAVNAFDRAAIGKALLTNNPVPLTW